MAISHKKARVDRLPTDLLHSILEKLILVEDHIRFSAVCKKWYSVVQDHHSKTKLFNNPPMLMIPQGRTRALYNFMERKTYAASRFEFDECLIGSTLGWLVTVSEDLVINLVNTFSGKKIQLPLISKVAPDVNPDDLIPNGRQDILKRLYPKYADLMKIGRVCKVILSDDPCSNPGNYIVAALLYYYSTVAFIRPGKDDSWTYLNWEVSFLDDVLFFKGQLLAVDYKDRLFKINDLDSPDVEILIPVCNYDCLKSSVLVESMDGELLHVKRFFLISRSDVKTYTKQFQIFKLGKVKSSGVEERLGWVEVKNLGSQTLFLGMGSSISVSVNDDVYPNIQKNSIYYMDYGRTIGDEKLGCDDVGVYDLKDKNIGPYHNACYDGIDKQLLPSFWVSPFMSIKAKSKSGAAGLTAIEAQDSDETRILEKEIKQQLALRRIFGKALLEACGRPSEKRKRDDDDNEKDARKLKKSR